MRFAAALFALTIALTSVNADIVAFSGYNCEGGEGDNVPCDGSCHQFGARNSFSVLIPGPVLVSVYSDTGCSSKVAQITNAGSSACSNVNTGSVLNIQSFTCILDNNGTVTTIIPGTTVSQIVIGPTTSSSSSSSSSSGTASSSSVSSAGSTSTSIASSSASPNKKILHWTGALLGLAAGNLLVF